MNPYRILSSKTVYENPWIHLIEHQILNPSGRQGIYGEVLFKNRAVGVVPYEDGHIWMVGQWRFPLKQYSWEIPEGGSPESETLEESARRELEEETGLRAEKLELLLRMHLSNSVSNEYGEVFLARGLTQGAARPEDTEQLEVKKMPFNEVYRMVEQGEITDSLTVAAVYKIKVLLLQGML